VERRNTKVFLPQSRHQEVASSSTTIPTLLYMKSGSDGAASAPSTLSISSLKPLYDGTNYTFPDTTTPSGVAELLEVSFVKACLQLASGYVDVLKMFIAASAAAYQYGFSVTTVQEELAKCKRQTANRPLLPEEERLRLNWLCIVYLTLESMRNPAQRENLVDESIPIEIKEEYQNVVLRVGEAFQSHDPIPSVESLLTFKDTFDTTTSEVDKAILSQSLRVATLTPVVIQEIILARGDRDDRLNPPIKGAFE
jgi:hypothetical protein